MVWVETVTRRVGGGPWPRGGKKRQTRLDIAGRRRERHNEIEKKVVMAQGSSVEFCEAALITWPSQVEGITTSSLCGRETDRDLRGAYHAACYNKVFTKSGLNTICRLNPLVEILL